MKRNFFKAVGRVFVSLLLIPILSVMVPGGAGAEDTIKIGLIDPFSGPADYAGRCFLAGLKFAVDEQNAKGGLLGKKIEILSEDDEYKPDTAVRKAKKLILKDKVNFIGSGAGSHIAIALSKVVASYKTIYINYGFSQPVSKEDFTRYAFRTNMSPYNAASAAAQFMAKKPYRRFYIVSQDYVYGHATAKTFKEQLKIHLPEAKIVGEDYHPLGTKDFAPYISKIIAAKADCVYTPNFGLDGANLIKQARALGLTKPFPFVTISMVDPLLMNYLKGDAEGIYYVYSYSLEVNTPENKQMIAKFHQQHKNDKDYMLWWPAANAGSLIISWNMLFAAVEKAGSLDPEKIIAAFEGLRFKSPVGVREMRKADHQVLLPMFGGVMTESNRYFNGSIRPEVKFPFEGSDIVTIPAKKSASPPFGF